MTGLPVLRFESAAEYRRWLSSHHARSRGIWLRIYKKRSSRPSITYAEAVDQSLCYGWIDGQGQKYDRESWLQKFTPRRPRSGWSRINTERAARLIESGAMAPAGLKAVEAAKADGRWTAAYDSPRRATPPAEFLRALRKHKKAKTFFETLNKSNTYAIVYRLQTAKRPETRARRMKMILAMLAKGEKFHP